MEQLTADVTVIDAKQIERAAGSSLPELLQREAGLQMTSNGGLGKEASVFTRGTESRHTILLVDGVRYGSATSGGPSWANIPLASIERIEVIKGPASSLYGSDAVGGVVQIFTKKGKDGKPFSPYASVTLGSQHYAQAAAGLSGSQQGWNYALNAQRTTEHGFSSTNSKVAFGNYNPDRDPFRQSSLNASLGYELNSDWRVDGSMLYSEGINHFDDGPGVDTRSALRTQVSTASVTGRILKDWKSKFTISHSRDESNAIDSAQAYNLPGLFATTQRQYQWQNDIATPAGLVVAGFERLEQEVNSSTKYSVTERTVNSGFIGLTGEQGAHSWQANLRRDDNSQFGSKNTWGVGYGLRLNSQWRVHASHGTSFVAPTFNQLYWPDYGSPDLKPEFGRNTDVGVTWSEGGHTVKLIYFDNRIRGYIANTTKPENIPRSRIRGWTLGYSGQLMGWNVRADYDQLDPRNTLTDTLLPRRARHVTRLSADKDFGGWTFGASAQSVGKRYDDAKNSADKLMGQYTTVDLYASYRLDKDWTLSARIANLTDKDYTTAYGYNTRGRVGYLTLLWQPR
ncbi:MAG: TonB-dependent receptor [Comamonas sp.]|nr:TonB-dependent receptor [Comamonas sp.]